MSVGRTSNGYTDNLSGPAYDLAPFWPRTGGRARPPRLAGRPVTLAPQGFGQANPLAPNTTDADLARKPVARYGEAW